MMSDVLLMQLLTGAEQDGNVNSRVMTTLSLHRFTEVGHCLILTEQHGKGTK
jgi:hypothetical protein